MKDAHHYFLCLIFPNGICRKILIWKICLINAKKLLEFLLNSKSIIFTGNKVTEKQIKNHVKNAEYIKCPLKNGHIDLRYYMLPNDVKCQILARLNKIAEESGIKDRLCIEKEISFAIKF